MSENIILSQLTSGGYLELYPKTLASQIEDVYSKNEISNLFLPKAGESMSGILDTNGNKITNLPFPSTPSEPATKEYVDEFDPLFAKHKKVVTVSNYKNVSFSSEIEVKKIISVIYRINNFSASIESGYSEQSNSPLHINFTYNGSSRGEFEVINNMTAQDIRINTIIQKQREFSGAESPLFLSGASSNGLAFDGFSVGTTFINGAYLSFEYDSRFLFRNGNIEVWIRTIDD